MNVTSFHLTKLELNSPGSKIMDRINVSVVSVDAICLFDPVHTYNL